MATKGMYKLDDGNCYPANCFPARSLLRPRYEEGVGHWQVARQAAEKNKIELLFGTRPSQVKWKSQAALSGTFRHLDEKTLDGTHLMKLHHVKNPSELCSVDINNQNFVSANEHDFEQFSSVAYINATENLLTLEAFRKFPGLRELELSLNGLRNLKVNAGDFPHLEILDLSYNNLSPEDVQALGVLPHLKVLHLTANGLSSLPLDLAAPESERRPRFPALEVLLLDDNHLSHPNVFVSVANLRSLKQLNLDKNGIKEVPYLQHTDNSSFCIHPLSAKSGIREGLRSRKSAGKRLHQDGSPELSGKADYIIVQNGKDPDRTEIVFPSWSPDPPTQENSPSPRIASCASPSPEFTLPLPELRFLSLADNQIEQEEDLLAVALFPSLTELTFHGNPFTTSRSGDPPLLTSFLQNKLGIKLVRKNISKLEKPRIFIPNKANRKVTTQLPKVQKRPLMLEAPPETTFWQLWTGADLDPNKRSSLAESDPLPPIRSYSIPYDPEKPILPPLSKEDMSAPPSAVSSTSEDIVLKNIPMVQSSLDALLFGNVPSTQSSLDKFLSISSPPRRSVSEEQGQLEPAETVSAQQDLPGPLPPEENLSTPGPPMKNPSAEQDPSESALLISLPLAGQDQREPVPPPSLPLQELVPAPEPTTPEQDLSKSLPPVNFVTKEDQSQPVTPPNSPLLEQRHSEEPAPPNETPAEEQDLARTLPSVRSLLAEENLSEAFPPARVPVVEQGELEPVPPASPTSQALGLSEPVSSTGLSAGVLGTPSLTTSPPEGQDHIKLSPPCLSTSKVEGLSGIISSHPSGAPSLTTSPLEGQDQVERSPPCLSTSKVEGLLGSVSQQPSGILLPTIPPVEGQDHVELAPPCISTSKVKGLSGSVSSHPSGALSPTRSPLEGHDQVEPALPHGSTSPGQALSEPVSLVTSPTEEQDLPESLPPTRSLPADQDQLESVPLPTSPSEEHNLSQTMPPTESPEGGEDLDGSLPPSAEYHLQASVPTTSPPAEQDLSEPAPPAPSTFQGSTPSCSPSSSSSPESQDLMDAFPFSGPFAVRTVSSLLVPPSRSTSGELYKLFAKARSAAVPAECPSEDEMFHSSGEFEEEEESESFFMTQVDEASGSHLKPPREGSPPKQPTKDKKREWQVMPEKYKGYEELLGGDPGPDFIEPRGIQQNVKALENALRYQRRYRESKARLDTFQKPFVPAEKKALRVPAPPAQKTKAERLEEILLKMRNPTNIVQVPLVCILRRKKENWREYREALALMKEFRENYKATVASCNLDSESKSTSKKCVDAADINQNQLLCSLPKVKVNKEQLEEFPFRVTQEDEGLSSISLEKDFPPTQQC